jgi:hypothetical protein
MLIAGDKHFHDYRALLATLDALLANRFPDVKLLTVGGPGVADASRDPAGYATMPRAAH